MCNKKATNFVMVWIWSSLHKGMCLEVLVPENGSIPWDVIDHEGSEWMNGFIPWWTHNLMALLGGDGNFPMWGLVEGSMLLGVPMAVATHLFSVSLSLVAVNWWASSTFPTTMLSHMPKVDRASQPEKWFEVCYLLPSTEAAITCAVWSGTGTESRMLSLL